MIISISGKLNSGKDTVGEIVQIISASPHFTDEAVLSFIGRQHLNSIWEIKKFADKLKDIVCMLLGCSREQLEDREFKEKELGEEWVNSKDDVYYGNFLSERYSPRSLLQLIGTNLFRERILNNIWVNALMSEYKIEVIPNENYGSNRTKPKNWIITKEEEHEYLLDNSHWVYKNEVNVISPNWIITDMRFPNELKAVKDKGGITIRVNRPCNICGGSGYHKMSCPVSKSGEHCSETVLDNAEFNYTINNDGTLLELIAKVRQILIEQKILKNE